MKDNIKKTYAGLKCIDDEEFGNHLILLYENEKRGLAAQFRYLYNGLVKKERAIYLTPEDPQDIEDEMSDYIDVDTFKKKGLLHVFQIPDNISSSDDAFKLLDEILKMTRSYGKSYFRIVGLMIPNIKAKNGKELELSVEKKLQKVLAQYNSYFLCPYPIVKVKDSYEKEWMNDILRNHCDVIYVPKSGEGTSFDAAFML